MTTPAPPRPPVPLAAVPPPPALAPEMLFRLSEVIAAHLGLHFPPDRWVELERGFRPAARDLGFDDPAACAEALSAGPLTRRQVQALAAHLTIGETYFFREPGSFRALEERLLPELLAARLAQGGHNHARRLRLWSAACCTGEEAYSLAICLLRTLGDMRGWDVKVLATDVNVRFLEKAEAGVYGEWSFRDAPPAVRERYFRRTAHGRYEVVPEVRRLVKFDYLNLAADSFPPVPGEAGPVDVLFCRNVMIYLEPGQAGRLAGRLGRCLAAGGWLFVGAAETSQTLFAGLKADYFHDAIAYRKADEGAAAGTPAGAAGVMEPTPFHPLVVTPAAPSPDAPPPDGTSGGEAAAAAQPSAAAAARACADRGELAEALSHSEKAIAADKLDPALQYLRGTILQEMGDSAGALACWKRALYLDPSFVMAHFATGHLLRGRGDRRAAARHLVHAAGLLRAAGPQQTVPDSDGLSPARLAEMIESMLRAPAPDETAGRGQESAE